jgi:DNA repair exonuclease SbcCD nuclease subunit
MDPRQGHRYGRALSGAAMARFLHTGDLHLKGTRSEDSDYSLECLRVLVDRAAELKVDALLLCGDVFDREEDYADRDFLARVVAILDRCPTRILYIPGNHEDLEGRFTRLKNAELGSRLSLITSPSLHEVAGVEILAVPHAPAYDSFAAWQIAPRRGAHRIAIAHGEIPGYQFDGDEEQASVLNPAIFLHHGVSDVLLGHIHVPGSIEISGVRFVYSGSPRPVRSKETEVRGFNLVEVGGASGEAVRVSRVELPELGVMRRLHVAAIEPDWAHQVEQQVKQFGPKDRVKVLLEGLAPDGLDLDGAIRTLSPKLEEICRRVEFEKRVEPLEDLLQNPFYRRIHEAWQSRRPEQGTRRYRAWLQMLNQLKTLRKELRR